MIANTTKTKLNAGSSVYGAFVRYHDATLAEFIALAGWDFLVFDAEHSTLQPADVADLARAAELRGVTPLARVTTNEPSTILRFLDAGAHGVHVPWVNTAAEAEQVVRSVKYGPRGVRGLAGNRGADWLANAETAAAANRETLVVVQIETAHAVERIDEFITIQDIDVLFLGPSDLSHSLGFPGEPGHPTVRAAMEQVAAAVAGSSKTLGVFVGSPEGVADWQSLGARYFATGIEGLLRPAMREFLQAATHETEG
jgi:4-hydroxy-2-oxoheptanedioate aldolase